MIKIFPFFSAFGRNKVLYIYIINFTVLDFTIYIYCNYPMYIKKNLKRRSSSRQNGTEIIRPTQRAGIVISTFDLIKLCNPLFNTLQQLPSCSWYVLVYINARGIICIYISPHPPPSCGDNSSFLGSCK